MNKSFLKIQVMRAEQKGPEVPPKPNEPKTPRPSPEVAPSHAEPGQAPPPLPPEVKPTPGPPVEPTQKRTTILKHNAMKTKTIFSVILFCLLFIQTSFSQQVEENQIKDNKKNDFFYFGPLDLFYNTLQLGYEHKIKNHNSIAILGGFKLSRKDEVTDRLGCNGEAQYRINLLYNKEALSPVVKNYTTFAYFAPYFQYRYEEIYYGYIQSSPLNGKVQTIVNSYFGGLGFGFRLTAAQSRFTLNVFAGGGLKYSDITGTKNYTGFTEVAYTGISPKVEFHMGIAF